MSASAGKEGALVSSQNGAPTDNMGYMREMPGGLTNQQPVKLPKLTVKCDICNLEFGTQTVLDSHVAGSKHQRKMKSVELLKSMEPMQDEFVRDEVSGVIRCTVCNITVNSPQLLATHMAGNKHRAQSQRKRDRTEEGGGKDDTPASKRPCVKGEQKDDCAGVTGNTASTSSKKKKKKKKKDPAKGARAEESSTTPTIVLPQCVSKLDSSSGSVTYACNPCNALCNSEQQLAQHLSSRKHGEKMRGPVTKPGFTRGRGFSPGRGRGAFARPNSEDETGQRGRGPWGSGRGARGGRGRGMRGGGGGSNSWAQPPGEVQSDRRGSLAGSRGGRGGYQSSKEGGGRYRGRPWDPNKASVGGGRYEEDSGWEVTADHYCDVGSRGRGRGDGRQQYYGGGDADGWYAAEEDVGGGSYTGRGGGYHVRSRGYASGTAVGTSTGGGGSGFGESSSGDAGYSSQWRDVGVGRQQYGREGGAGVQDEYGGATRADQGSAATYGGGSCVVERMNLVEQLNKWKNPPPPPPPYLGYEGGHQYQCDGVSFLQQQAAAGYGAARQRLSAAQQPQFTHTYTEPPLSHSFVQGSIMM